MRHTLTPCPLLAHQQGRAEFTQSIITQAARCCHLGDAVSHIETYDVRERVSQRHANTLPLALSQPPWSDCERDATWMPIYSDKTQKAHRACWRSDAGPIKKRLCFWIYKCSLIQLQGSGCLILSSSGLNQLASLVALEGIAKKRNQSFPKHPNCPLSFGQTASPTPMPISISMTQRGFLVDGKSKKFNSGNTFWESYLSIYLSIHLSFFMGFFPRTRLNKALWSQQSSWPLFF